MSYTNLNNVPSQLAGTSEVLAEDWNTYVRDNFDALKYGHLLATESPDTRPSGAAEGTMVYTTDSNKLFVRSLSGWVEVSGLDNIGALSETNPGHLTVTTAEKNALTPIAGMMVYDTTLGVHQVWTGSAWIKSSGLYLINTTTISAQTTTTIDNIFSSTFINYKVVTRLTSSVSPYSYLRWRFRSGSPATTDTATNYWWALRTLDTTPTSGSQALASRNAFMAGFSSRSGRPNAVADFNIYSPNVATDTSVLGSSTFQDLSYIGYGSFGAGNNTTTQYTGLLLENDQGGTLTGTIKIYGYLND